MQLISQAPRILRLATMLAVVLIAPVVLATPAAACGCGAYVPREGDAHIAQERALIRWDGRSEDIVMALSVAGRSQEAAWILPVPAQATVKLADAQLFDALQTLTKPLERVEYLRGDGATGGAPPGAGVTVLERRELGPFDVATLAADDSAALSGWLSDNGFVFPPGLQAALEPYVAQGWLYVAVRLAPQTPAEGLSGDLDPLWVSFESDTLVYPMRLSALAEDALPVFLYVLAEHRVAQPPAFDGNGTLPGRSEVSYAQWLEPDSLEPDSPLAPFIDRRFFLTKFEMFLDRPEALTDDFVFSFAPSDELVHKTTVRYETRPGPSPAWIAALAVLGVAAVAGVLVVRMRLRKR